MSHALKTRNLIDDMSGSQEYSHECAGVILREINDRSLRTNETFVSMRLRFAKCLRLPSTMY